MPEPFYVASARDELLRYASKHPELCLLLDALDEAARFANAIRRIRDQSVYGSVRSVLMGRYGMGNAASDACGDIASLARDWADDQDWESDDD